MLWRTVSLIYLLGLILTTPVGSAVQEDPCQQLTRGIINIGAESIVYHSYYFYEDEQFCPDTLREILSRHTVKVGGLSGTQWSVTGMPAEGYNIIHAFGSNFAELCRIREELSLLKLDEAEQVWNVECFLPGQKDLLSLSEEILQVLGATLYSNEEYNGSVNLLATTPWGTEGFMLEGQKINLNIELYPLKERVRVKVGMPLLLSAYHF